jgi:hypothetical protein
MAPSIIGGGIQPGLHEHETHNSLRDVDCRSGGWIGRLPVEPPLGVVEIARSH